MSLEIAEILKAHNTGAVKDRVDMHDANACLMFLFGTSRDEAYWLAKVGSSISDDVLSSRAKLYFGSEKIGKLLEALRFYVEKRKGGVEKADIGGATIDWAAADIEMLSAEELEKMGTFMLRAAASSSETTPKDINDMIKFLDSIGALPKKKQEDKDIKQVIIEPVYNTICPFCNHEVYVNDRAEGINPADGDSQDGKKSKSTKKAKVSGEVKKKVAKRVKKVEKK